ncbi:MAG: Ig-like domain-containing protein, partial [Rikenellaceae bacterium]
RMKDGKVHKGGKGSTTYRGEQVPLIFSAPKLIPAAKGKDMRTYEPAVDITDIYPTIMTAAGIEIPNANKIDGVSLWSQLQGKSEEAHRPHIYKWYNANNTQNNLEVMMRYAQTPDFKYYAPNADYPEGRFFDLRTDPEEIHGVKGRKLGWERYWYAGLDLKKLTPEQKKAYLELKAEVDKHAYTKVKKIEITSAPSTIKAGEIAQLKDVVTPSNATRNGVIWVSSDKSIATVDKFGRVKALKTGEVTITLHSWDDAWPVANGSKRGGYKVDGMKDQVKIKII